MSSTRDKFALVGEWVMNVLLIIIFSTVIGVCLKVGFNMVATPTTPVRTECVKQGMIESCLSYEDAGQQRR